MVTLEELLRRLVPLLAASNEPAWSSRLDSLLKEVQATTGDEVGYQRTLHRILQLYTVGMGGFGDLVLQADGRVLPEQRDLEILRQRLFAAARDQIRSCSS